MIALVVETPGGRMEQPLADPRQVCRMIAALAEAVAPAMRSATTWCCQEIIERPTRASIEPWHRIAAAFPTTEEPCP